MNKLVFGILFTLSMIMILISVVFHGQTAHSHEFSTTDESSLVTLVEQIKAETQLVITSFLSNENLSS